MRIEEIMTKNVISITVKATVAEIASKLFKNGLSGLPVVDEENKVIGIVTEYDIMCKPLDVNIPLYVNLLKTVEKENGGTRVFDELEAIRQTTAKQIMSFPVVTLLPEDEAGKAALIFSGQRLNPLPVTDKNGRLVGIVSRADIVKLFSRM